MRRPPSRPADRTHAPYRLGAAQGTRGRRPGRPRRCRIRNYEPCVVPSLLQVPEYTRAILGTSGVGRNAAMLLNFRVSRQQEQVQRRR
jgi:hypothetical protein